MQIKHKQEKAFEIQKAKDQVIKEKDLELRQVIRHREDDLKQLKTQLLEEKEEAVKVKFTYELYSFSF